MASNQSPSSTPSRHPTTPPRTRKPRQTQGSRPSTAPNRESYRPSNRHAKVGVSLNDRHAVGPTMSGGSSALGPVTSSPGQQLLGRRRERELLDRLLEAAGSGDGGALVIHGEAGVGKTALLEYAVEAARAFRVLRTVGVEAEMELPFAALQQLCSPILELNRAPPASPARRPCCRFRPERWAVRRTRSWSGWRPSVWCPRPRKSDRFCVPSTTRSGSIVRRRGRSSS